MASPGQHKRLRVRLKARDPAGLARDFGPLLREDGMFLPCRELLPPSTPIRLQMLYTDGSPALEGRGHVLRREVRPMPGLNMVLVWDEGSGALVRWCRATSAAAAEGRPPAGPPPPSIAPAGGLMAPSAPTLPAPMPPVKVESERSDSHPGATPSGPAPQVADHRSLIEDLEEPRPVAIRAPAADEDEPLESRSAAPSYSPSPGAELPDDEPLPMVDDPVIAPDALQADEPSAVVDLAVPAGLPPDPEDDPKTGGAGNEPSPPPAADDFDLVMLEPADPGFEDFLESVTVIAQVPQTDEAAEDEQEAEVVSAESIESVEPIERAEASAPVAPVALLPSETGAVVIATPVEGIAFEQQGTTELVDEAALQADPKLLIPVEPAPLSIDSALPKGVIRLDEIGSSDEIPLPTGSLPDPSAVAIQPVAPVTPVDPVQPVKSLRKQPEPAREPGEVTPLARIALVRRRVDARTGDVEDVPPTAILSKKHRSPLPPPGRRVIGIDLGTATTGLAAVVQGRPKLIAARSGTLVIPSVVAIEESGRTFVGEAAARKLPWQPKLGIAGPGRLLGRVAAGPQALSWESETICPLEAADDGEVAAVFGPHKVSIEEVVALLLKEVRLSASSGLREPVNRAVLTCPTFFGARQRQALRVAAELAGIHVERTVCTPLAAAVQAGRGREQTSRTMVVDCGAGALDVGLVSVTPDGFELVAGRGSRELGGDAYDQLLVRYLANATEGLQGAAGLGGYFDIREAAELGKWALSDQESTHIEITHAGPDVPAEDAWKLSAEIRRSEAEDLFEPLVSRSIEICKRACEDAGWTLDSIDEIVPVGGQARMPLLLNRLRETFRAKMAGIDPQTAVPYGAARIAQRIAEGRPLTLRELVPQTVVVGEKYGSVTRLIQRGRPLPASQEHRMEVTTTDDLELLLFEGEALHVTQVEPLIRLSLQDLPSGLEPPFTVRLSVAMSEEGLLAFEATEESTGATLKTVMRGDLTPEVINGSLHLPPQPTPAPGGDNVFAWLLKRLEDAESARSGDLPRI